MHYATQPSDYRKNVFFVWRAKNLFAFSSSIGDRLDFCRYTFTRPKKDILTHRSHILEISGSVADRPGLKKLKEILRKGDTLIVWRLDRLGRTLKHLIEWVNELSDKNIGFKSLHETIDTSHSSGKLIFHIFGALSEFERNLIRERTTAGLAAARARGRQGGRPKKLNKDKRLLAVSLYKGKKHSVKQICEMVSVSKPTLYKYVKELES